MLLSQASIDCDRINLTDTFTIQPFTSVLIIDADERLLAVSVNFFQLYGLSEDNFINKPTHKLDEVFGHGFYEKISSHQSRHHERFILANQTILWFRRHQCKGFTVVEMENEQKPPKITDGAYFIESYNQLINQKNNKRSHKTLLNQLVNIVHSFFQVDAVRIYQFKENNTGEVIAEKVSALVPSYLGFRFPATDVPKPVRALLCKQLYRYIPNIHATSTAIFLTFDGLGDCLLATDAYAVSPIHQMYLENMKVVAAFSVPIVLEGKLWGLLACQHTKPMTLHPNDRFYCRLLVEHAALNISNEEKTQKEVESKACLAMYKKLHPVLLETTSISEFFAHKKINILKLMGASGYACLIANELFSQGKTPSEKEIRDLITWLRKKKKTELFYCDNLPVRYPKARKFTEKMCGLYAHAITTDLKNYLLVFRTEHVYSLNWAGNPHQSIQLNKDNSYSPRQSFARWEEEVSLHSKKWRFSDLQMGELFSRLLLDKWVQIRLHEQSYIDALTKAYNRRFLTNFIESYKKNRRKEVSKLTIGMIDLDNFKKLNDSYSHLFGDHVLSTIAAVLMENIRKTDLVIRYGGEEFLLILHQCSSKDALPLMEKIRQMIESLTFSPIKNSTVQVTCSIGLTEANVEENFEFSKWLTRCDKALYQAKNQGKNQVVVL